MIQTMIPGEPGTTLVTARSGMSGATNTRTIPLAFNALQAGLRAREAGAMIQDAFPDLSADDREFLMTGITPEEWDTAFAD